LNGSVFLKLSQLLTSYFTATKPSILLTVHLNEQNKTNSEKNKNPLERKHTGHR